LTIPFLRDMTQKINLNRVPGQFIGIVKIRRNNHLSFEMICTILRNRKSVAFLRPSLYRLERPEIEKFKVPDKREQTLNSQQSD
jgi:hypothetical protein